MMNLKYKLNIVLVAFLSYLSMNANPNSDNCSHGNGRIISQDRQVQDFSKIIMNGYGNLYIKQGNSNYIRVDVDDNLINFIKTGFSNGSLFISVDRPICTRNLNVFITFKNIDAINLKGAGDVYGKGNINLNQLQVILDGSGSMNFDNLIVNDLNTIIDGSGDIQIRGNGNILNSIINGSGDIYMQDYQANFVKAIINGSGDIKIYSREKIDINIQGSGDVLFYGNPKQVYQYIHGSGDVRQVKR